jgi:prephenate dehydrogenase
MEDRELVNKLAAVIYEFLGHQISYDPEFYAETCHRARNLLAIHETQRAIRELDMAV